MGEVTKDELARRLGEDGLLVLDVRTEGEFRGETGYPCDPRQGRVPGARHVEVQDLLARSPDEVRAFLGAPEGTEVVTYCHSGARSAMAATALRQAGFQARNYAGSWHEWSRDESLPAESG